MEQELLPLEQSSCLHKEYSKLMLLVKELHVVSQIFFLAKAFVCQRTKWETAQYRKLNGSLGDHLEDATGVFTFQSL